MSVMAQSYFADLLPYFKLERHGTSNKYTRIEFRLMPMAMHARAVSLEMSCVACGRRINPVRARVGKNKRSDEVGKHLYFTPCCTIAENIGCSRSGEARDEHARVVYAVRDYQTQMTELRNEI